ncbi:putative ribonuclease VapC protein [Halorhabdus tiamatea SARL4B]|uniref:Putative ribonuclease VapC protein n=1 Tax=Halorhabdus tiamatea SARL4B TaxID=1033806 RepID=U2DNN7_9EURY|nr:PIN domain-containing protein [Halorhabdus tiamatea]ERJ07287.1 putative ribonuclease VapC protein [Halorhabdus tiamatea SARL4B]
MSVFLDSGLFYALQNERATRHKAAKAAFESVLSSEYGRVFTSDYVFDETVTLVRTRTGSYDEAKQVADRILGRGPFPSAIDFLVTDRADFERAVEAFNRYHDHDLSFTDATTIALVEARDIDHVLAFDDDFDGIVDRLDPVELA